MSIDLAVDQIWELKVYFESRGQVGINTYHYKIDTPLAAGATTDDFFEGLQLGVPAYLQMVTSIAFYRGMSLQLQSAIPKPALQEYPVVGTPGTAGTAPLPAQDCPIIAKKTQYAGPSYRGRVYLPFPDNAQINPDTAQITAAGVGRMNVIAAWFLSSRDLAPAIGPVKVIALLKQKGIAPSVWPVVTAYQARTRVATQRRRGDYGKLNPSPL